MKKFAIFLASIAMFLGLSTTVLAAACGGSASAGWTCPNGYAPSLGYGVDGTCACNSIFGAEDVNSIGTTTGLEDTTLPKIIGNIVKAVLGLFGIVATVIIVYGGVKWMTSQGDTNKIDSAKKLMIAGAIGMVLIISGYAITTFLIENILKKAVQ